VQSNLRATSTDEVPGCYLIYFVKLERTSSTRGRRLDARH